MAKMADIAPRLYRAHRAYAAALAEESHQQVRLLRAITKMEALVAHRELQYQRAAFRSDPRYLARRAAKLEHAQALLVELRLELAVVDAWRAAA